ncbi:uncharacterized protein [Elaeis guineensis]|uniref:uncharacterized protein n=1 Tax=Elaeis guineensis var. tenera TaxID=51953 RepID=UPI003C6D262C
MVPSVAHTVEALTNAYELWQAVATTSSYKGNNMHAHKIQRELRGLNQGFRSVTEYVGELKRLWNDFDFYSPFTPTHPGDVDVFRKWIERQRLVDFLDGLNPEFEYRRSSILSTQKWPTLDKTISLVLSEETRLTTMSSSMNTAIRSALVVQPNTLGSSSPNSAQETQPRPRGVKICDHCHKPGHIKAYCYELHGHPNRGRGRGGGRFGRGRGQYNQAHFSSMGDLSVDEMQLLKKFRSGVNISECSTSTEDSSNQPASSQDNFAQIGISDQIHALNCSNFSPWVVDSEASNHMTGSFRDFVSYIPCSGRDKVRLADGSFTPISEKGSIKCTFKLPLSSVLHEPKTGRKFGTGIMRNGLYYLEGGVSEGYSETSLTVSSSQKEDLLLQHRRLGHLSFTLLARIFPTVFETYKEKLVCDACELAKHTRSTYPNSGRRSKAMFEIFGCVCFVRNHRPSVGKLDARALKCIFVGYSATQKGYKCWCPTERKMFISIDVTFRKSEPFYISSVSSSSPVISGTGREGESSGGSPITVDVTMDVGTNGASDTQGEASDTQGEASETSSETLPQLVLSDSSPLSESITHSPVSRSSSPVPTVSSSTTNGNSPVPPIHFTLDNDDLNVPIALRKPTRHAGIPTRLKDGVGYKHDITNFVSYESLSPPYQSFIASLSSVSIPENWKVAKENPKWKAAMLEEMQALEKNNTWKLLDVKNAFLHGELQEEVYMDVPPGFATAQTVGKVCQLRRSLYGLKQSPRAWFDRFRQAIIQMGYKQSNADHTLFFRHNMGKIAVLIVYVDDIVVTGDDSEEIAHLKAQLAQAFEVKDLGHLRYFLGIEVARSLKRIFLSQRKYILDLLTEVGMLGYRPIATPIEQNHRLVADTGVPIDRERYQRLVGRLIYLSHTRPDIAFAVSVVSQFMYDLRSVHMDAVTRILRYLKSCPGRGLLYSNHGNLRVECYTDADWAGSFDDRRSISGYCIFVGGCCLLYRCFCSAGQYFCIADFFNGVAEGLCSGPRRQAEDTLVKEVESAVNGLFHRKNEIKEIQHVAKYVASLKCHAKHVTTKQVAPPSDTLTSSHNSAPKEDDGRCTSAGDFADNIIKRMTSSHVIMEIYRQHYKGWFERVSG